MPAGQVGELSAVRRPAPGLLLEGPSLSGALSPEGSAGTAGVCLVSEPGGRGSFRGRQSRSDNSSCGRPQDERRTEPVRLLATALTPRRLLLGRCHLGISDRGGLGRGGEGGLDL